MINDLNSNRSGSGLAGVYRGKVLEHLSHGYCKIMIHGIYPIEWESNPEFLPRAEQASPIFAGTNNGNGTFSYPNIGSTVWCMFANGDQNYPIYFAAALGGQNAYGLHELVLKQDEDISERHMITSGKTHIEWYENGKISATVEDPSRRDASVVYNVDDDYVVERPIWEKVDAREISNILCQSVMDNHYNDGEISSSTYVYMPSSFTSVEIVSGDLSDASTLGGQAQVKTTEFNKENDICSYCIKNNAGNYEYGIISVGEDNTLTTSTDVKNLSNDIFSSKNESVAENKLKNTLDGITTHDIKNIGEKSKVSTFILLKIDPNTGAPIPIKMIVDTKLSDELYQLWNIKDDTLNVEQDSILNITQKINYEYLERDPNSNALTNILSTMKDNTIKNNYLNNNNVSTDNRNEYTYQYSHSLNEIRPLETYTYLETHKFNKDSSSGTNALRDDSAAINLYDKTNTKHYALLIQGGSNIENVKKNTKTLTDNGLKIDYNNIFDLGILSTYKFEDLSIVNGSPIYNMTDLKNIQNISADIGNITITSEHHLKKLINASSESEKPIIKNNATAKFEIKSLDDTGCILESDNKKTKMLFNLSVDTVKGELQILIIDNDSKKSSKMTMDAKGNVLIKSSTSMSIETPAVTIDAKTISIKGSSQIDMQTSNLNVKASSTMNVDAGTLNAKGSGGDCKINNVSLLLHKHVEMLTGDIVTAGSTYTLSATASN